jgi:hypothetical protein
MYINPFIPQHTLPVFLLSLKVLFVVEHQKSGFFFSGGEEALHCWGRGVGSALLGEKLDGGMEWGSIEN